MQIITISGNCARDAELRTVRDNQVLGFNVGVKNGFGRDAGTVWYRCSLWGKAAEVFADSIKKGTKVFIQGELTHDEYEGKPQYNVRVGSIDTGPRVEGAGDQWQQPAEGNERNAGSAGKYSQSNQQAGFQSSAQDADLDDDVPF